MQEIAIVGSGVNAAFWAVRAARIGSQVRLLGATRRTRACVASMLRDAVIKNEVHSSHTSETSSRIAYQKGMDVEGCDMVIEAFDHPLSRGPFFRDLSQQMSAGAILALTTSSLEQVTQEVLWPEQVVALQMNERKAPTVRSTPSSAPGAVEATWVFCRSLCADSLAGAA